MIQLSLGSKTFRFCSTCRRQLVTRHDDGDVLSFGCPDGHESLLSYKTMEGLKKYVMELFAPKIGMGAKE